MSDNTGIEWTDATWDPVTGCTEVTPGCDHCYAKTFAERWRGTEGHYFENGFDVQLRPDKLDQPLRWKKPRKIFVNSMSDLFHDDVPANYIAEVWSVMAMSPRHTFQVLTKRHARMRSLLSSPGFRELVAANMHPNEPNPDHMHDWIRYHAPWPLPNVWLGVSAENQQWADIRIPALLDTPATVRFVSAEPLLGPISLKQSLAKWAPALDHPNWDGADKMMARDMLHWVIVGGESGRGARPMHPDWARQIRDDCERGGISFLFKQWGEWLGVLGPEHDLWTPQAYVNAATGELADEAAAITAGGDWTGVWRLGKKVAGRTLDGRTWDQYPETVSA